MANEGKVHRTADLITAGVLTINDGYRAKSSELCPSGLPFARAGNINNGFRFTDADHFPEADLGKVGIKVSQPGDVVFALHFLPNSSPGRTCRTGQPVAVEHAVFGAGEGNMPASLAKISQ